MTWKQMSGEYAASVYTRDHQDGWTEGESQTTRLSDEEWRAREAQRRVLFDDLPAILVEELEVKEPEEQEAKLPFLASQYLEGKGKK